MRLKKLNFIAIILFVFFQLGMAQVMNEDGLKQAVLIASEDSTKANLYRQYATSVLADEKEKAIKYYSKTLIFEKRTPDRASILYTMGMASWQLGNYRNAIEYFNKSLVYFTELNDSLYLGRIYNNIAVSNWGLRNSNEALSYYQRSLQIRRATNDQKGISNILNNIGLIYQDWELFEDAIKWHNDALNIAQAIDNKDAIAYSYSNIALCSEHLNQLDSALKYHFIAYHTLFAVDENNRSNSYFMDNLGSVYFKMKKLDSSLIHYKKSLQYASDINSKFRIATAKFHLGRTHFALNQFKLANKYANESLSLSKQNDYSSLIKDNLFVLAKIADYQGDDALAYQYFRDASALKDSIFNRDKMTKFTDLQIKYNLEQQMKENLLLKKNNEIQEVIIRQHQMVNIIIVVGGILILIVLFFIARSRYAFKKLSIKLEKSEKELIKANADKDKFFTIIAHDLKSPFNTILGFSEVLKSDHLDLSVDDRSRMIGSIRNSANTTYKLLENLLIWSRNETGKIQFNPTKVDLLEVIKEVIALNQAFAESKNIKLVNKIQSSTYAMADSDMINTIIRNLISNAIKFTDTSGTVTISADQILRDESQQFQVSVSDNGIGIGEEDIEKLFKLTGNHSNIGTNDEKGTGLGLILCKEFVHKHQGEIWVESEKGFGSTFYFTLPISAK